MPSIERAFAVWLNESRVGTLYTYENFTRFILDNTYIQNPNRSVLGLRFEQDLHAQYRSNLRLPPWFSNLLPEGSLRQWIAEQQGVAEVREMELLAGVGHDLPGAVRVTEDHEFPQLSPFSGRELVSREPENDIKESIWRFSLAGVALKFSMLKRGERFTAPAIGEGGDWIVKLPDPLYPEVPRNEFAMMQLARFAGLEIPEIRLVPRDLLSNLPQSVWQRQEEMAFAIKRFDRTNGGKRVHMEDIAQVRGFYPEYKYNGSFETVGALIYRKHDKNSLVEFAKRLAFNILIGNGDAHLKNWSLLYVDPRIPRLSPAYDLVSTAVYRPSNEPEDLGLRFGGSRRFESVSLDNFQRLQTKLEVDGISLVDEVEGFANRVQNEWHKIEDIIAVSPLLREIKQGFELRLKSLLRSKQM